MEIQDPIRSQEKEEKVEEPRHQKGPVQSRRRIVEKEDPIPKLNHLFTGTENFARWYKGLKLSFEMKDLDVTTV